VGREGGEEERWTREAEEERTDGAGESLTSTLPRQHWDRNGGAGRPIKILRDVLYIAQLFRPVVRVAVRVRLLGFRL
jgi:hypothetical protein